ncbi:pyridoxine 5'-phosphate synthase [Salmonella enterica subsp. enterica]|nr:pyridoxine 5'-phosphate synthase [Salmonella enterica subsp. enterica]
MRNARGTELSDPVRAAFIAEQAGADGITVHLREDQSPHYRRDIAHSASGAAYAYESGDGGDRRDAGLEICVEAGHFCCLVRKTPEVTTEGGLDVAGQRAVNT